MARRAHATLVLIPLLAASAGSCVKRGKGAASPTGGEAPRAASLDEAKCRSARVPTDPWLAAVDPAVRASLLARASSGLVAVKYVRDGCRVTLEVLGACEVRGTYRYRGRTIKKPALIHDADALLGEAPLAVARLGGAIDDPGAIMIDALAVGVLGIGPDAGIRRADLGAGCADATHVVTQIQIGKLRTLVGSLEALMKIGTGSGDLGSVQVIEDEGTADACREARANGRRVAGCEVPVRIEMVALGAPEEQRTGEMVTIPAGSFVRGRVGGPKDEAPPRSLVLDAFQIDRSEVTAAEYDACVVQGKCTPAGTGRFCTSGVLGKESHPINCIHWDQARAYCESVGKRLPTEAEWEKAARGPTPATFPWGEGWPPPPGAGNFADAAARREMPHWLGVEGYEDGFVATAPASSFAEMGGPFGVIQMAGNVSEWTADWYGPYGTTAAAPKTGKARVVRGGSFGTSHPEQLSATHRAFYVPSTVSIHFGVRCAK